MTSFVDADAVEALASEAVEDAADAEAHEEPRVDPEDNGALDPAVIGSALDLPTVPAQDELRALVQLAVTLSAGKLVPKALQDSPNDTLLVLLTARDLGIALTTATRLCYPIDGKVTLAPKLKLAMVREQKLGRVWPDPANDAYSATWYAVRADDPDTVYQATFTWEDAQRPTGRNRLVGASCTPNDHGSDESCGCKDNWRNYPARMISWRAVGFLLDDAFGEVGAGLYSPDELGAITDEDGNVVIDVTEVGPLEGTAEPPSMARDRRRRERGPNPRDEPAPTQERARLDWMLRSLPPEAMDAVKTLWAQGVGVKISDLTVGKLATANAAADSLWKRAVGGEWGDWTPPDPPAPDSSQEALEGPAGTSTPAGPSEAQEGSQGVESGADSGTPLPELADLEAVIDWTKTLEVPAVEALCGEWGVNPGDEPSENDWRRALAVHVATALGFAD